MLQNWITPYKTQRLNYVFTELPVINTKLYLPIDGGITGRRLYGLRIAGTTELGDTIVEGNQALTVLSNAQLAGVVINLLDTKGNQFAENLPLETLLSASNGGLVRRFACQYIDVSRCWLTVLNVNGIEANYVIPFEFLTD